MWSAQDRFWCQCWFWCQLSAVIEMVAAAWVLSISGKLTQNITVNPFWKHGMFLCQQLEKAKILISHLTSEVVHCVSCPYLSVCIFCSFFSFLFLPSDDINLSQRCCLLGVFSTKWFLYSSVDARSMWTQVEMLRSLFILVCDFAQTYHPLQQAGVWHLPWAKSRACTVQNLRKAVLLSLS